MSRITSLHYENVANNNVRNMPTVSRDRLLRHDGRKAAFIGDSLDSAPEVENYNNYSKSGALLCNSKDPPHQDKAEISVLNNDTENINHESEIPATSGEKLKTELAQKPIFVNITSVYQAMTEDSRLYEAWRINTYMHEGFLDYVAGKIGANEIADIAERMYRDILAHNIHMGITDGNDLDFNEKLLISTHHTFIFSTVTNLYFDMHDKGFEYAKETFGFTHPVSDSFCYYDANYYYASKELQAIGDAIFTRIAQDEGLSGFRATDVYKVASVNVHCFNSQWAMRTGRGNAGVAIMKDVNISPPRDFKMFFSPFRHSLEARNNGSLYVVTANDPLNHNGLSGYDAYVLVPKGAELWRSLPFWMRLTKIDHDYGPGSAKVDGTFDISKYVAPGADFDQSVRDFFAKYVFNLFNGALTVWHDGAMTEYEVPFSVFDSTWQFDGKQIVPPDSYAGFVNNFEFHVFIQ